MAEKTNFTFPFARGMNEKPSERAQADGEMRVAENIRISKTGEFNKRKGFEDKNPVLFAGDSGSFTLPSNLQASAAYSDELVVFDGESAFSQYEDGKLKGRGTCVNVRGHKSNCSTNANSIAGAPAYSTIRDGSTDEIYEIMVWESREFGADDIESKTGTYPNIADTHNYRNKPSKLLYSVRHRDSGVFVIESQPIVHDGKDFVDRDLYLGSNNFYRPNTGSYQDLITVNGYGTASTLGTSSTDYKRDLANVVADGNALVLSGVYDTVYPAGNARMGCYLSSGVESGGVSPTSRGTIEAGSATYSTQYNNVAAVTKAAADMSNVKSYLNVEQGLNSPYFTTQPMLFNMADGYVTGDGNTEGCNVVLVFASQYNNDEGQAGLWSIYQAYWNFNSGIGNAQISTPTVLSDFGRQEVSLNFLTPIWDADLYHSADAGVSDDERSTGVVFAFQSAVKTSATEGEVIAQYYKFDGTDLDDTPSAGTKLERVANSSDLVIHPRGLGDTGSPKDAHGSQSPVRWSDNFIPTRLVVKGINQKRATNGGYVSSTSNVFTVIAKSYTDVDIAIYKGSAAWDGGGACAMTIATKEYLLAYTGTAPVYPSDLQTTWELDGTRQSFAGVTIDTSLNRWQCENLSLANAAVTNWSTSTSDAIYAFVEVAATQYSDTITWSSTVTSGGLDNSKYIQSENRWIIRRNLNDKNDTKVLLRNVNILSDAVYPTAGSRAYFCGHSVFDGDSSTARTALFNDEGEVVSVFASGDSALCHPYEMKQICANAFLFPNYPMYSLRSRLSYYSYPGTVKGMVVGPYVEGDGYYNMEFGVSTIDNATNSFQYNSSFNPKIAVFDFQPPRLYPNQQVSGSLFVGSGLLWAFSGNKFIENGFLQKPLIQSVNVLTSEYSLGSGAAGNDPGCRVGEYTIAAAYFYKDNNGVTHYSALEQYGSGADPDFVKVDAVAKKMRVRVTGIQLTNKRTGIARKDHLGQVINDKDSSTAGVAIFVGMSNTELRGDETFLRIEDLQLYTMVAMDTNHRYHDIDIDSPNGVVQFRDEATAAPELIKAKVSPVQPPCPTDLTSHKNILCISTTDGMIYPSQSFGSTLGSEQSMLCPLFSVANVISISEETNGAGASHIESNGNSLVAFNRNNVFLMAGDGPDQANKNTFLPPQIVFLDQGIEDSSICARIPAGIIYKSKHGYYLLGSEGLSFIGSPVEDYTHDPAGVQVVDETNEVIIPLRLLANITSTASGGASQALVGGRCLVYNYEFNQWYTWAVPGLVGIGAGPYLNDVQGLIRADGTRKLYFVASNGNILAERSSYYTDKIASDGNSYPVPMKVKTGQVKIGKFFSGFRLYRVGIPVYGHSATTLTIKLYYDGSASTSETFTATLGAGTYQSEIILKPAKQKCRTIAVEIEEDATNSGSADRGATLNGLGLLVAPRTVKMPYNVAVSKVPAGS